jgi:hypothetical protein
MRGKGKKDMQDNTLKAMIERVNSPVMDESTAVEVIAKLDAIMQRGREFHDTAQAFVCGSQADVDRATLTAGEIDKDIKAVVSMLGDAKKEAHARHKLFTSAENAATEAHNSAKSTLRERVATYIRAERERAQVEQDRINREAAEKAERERKALEAKAATMKTAAAQERYLERAAEVQAPVIQIAAPTATGMRLQERWTATVTDAGAFLRYVAERPNEWEGIVTINTAGLVRCKTAMKALTLPGVVFAKELK